MSNNPTLSQDDYFYKWPAGSISTVSSHAISAVAVVAVLFAGQTLPGNTRSQRDSISCKSINLLDKNGKVRLKMNIVEKGPAITFIDEKENRRALFMTDGLTFYDFKGLPRVGMLAGDDRSEFVLFGDDRNPRIWLFAKDSGDANGGFFDTKGKPRLSLGTSIDDTGVVLYDEEERERTVIGTMDKDGIKRPVSSMLLLNDEGKLIWSTP